MWALRWRNAIRWNEPASPDQDDEHSEADEDSSAFEYCPVLLRHRDDEGERHDEHGHCEAVDELPRVVELSHFPPP